MSAKGPEYTQEELLILSRRHDDTKFVIEFKARKQAAWDAAQPPKPAPPPIPVEPTVKVAIYTRVSTEEQGREGQSLQTQEDRGRAYARARNWTVIDVYTDESTGLDDNRAGYRRMFAERKRWEKVIFLKMDRAHRNTKNFGIMSERLNQWGKDFVSIDDGFDTSTPGGRFAQDMIIRLAQMESEQISARVLPNMETAKTNNVHTGRPPAGTAWDRELHRLVPSDLGIKVRRDFERVKAERNATTTAEIEGAMIEAGRINEYPKESKFAGHHVSLTVVRKIVAHLDIDADGAVALSPVVVPNSTSTAKGMWSRLQDLKDKDLLAVFQAMDPKTWREYCVKRRQMKLPPPGFASLDCPSKCWFEAGGKRRHNPRPPIKVPLTFPTTQERDRHVRREHPEVHDDR